MVGETLIDDSGESYTLGNEIGRGGFGVVYLSRLKSGQPCAVKVLGPITHSEYIESFKREVAAAAAVADTHVLKFLGSGKFSNLGKTYFFTVAEYCPDGSYRSKMTSAVEAGGSLISDFTQILLGLKALHQQIIHRDIKPENILVQGETLKVGDLGLSKSIDEMTQTLTFKGSGTPRYMAPEVWERQKITAATDLYAVGVMLFEAITGQPPFDAADAADLREMHHYSTAPRVKSIKADVPEHLDGIIKRLLEKNPSKRYQTAQEVIDAISVVPEEVPDSIAILRGRMRQSFDAAETQRLEERREAEQKQQAQKRIQYMEKQIMDEFDDVVATVNKGLQETHISRRSNFGEGSNYSFGNRTLHLSFFKSGALHFNVTAPSLKDELKKHYAVHAGSIYIQDGSERREGWNIVLVQPPDEMYGEWILVDSDISALSGKALKYPPAATDQRQLAENLAYHWMHVMHTWVLKTKSLERADVERILARLIP